MKKLSVLLALFCFLTNPIFAQNNFSPDVKRVAVFKNGYAFTYREGEAQIQNGWVYTTNTPIGVLGTIWGYATSPNVRVMQLLASENEKREMERVTDIAEILLANEGARIRFLDSYGKQFEGTYEIVSRNRNFAAPAVRTDFYTDEFREDQVTIALKTETSLMFFNASTIRNLEIVGQPKMEKIKFSKENRLALKVEGAKDGERVNLGIAALERGIRWIPAYRVEVKGSPVKEAKLELEAMLINELTDLKNSEVNFVVGVPHFLFQDQMSPLSINTAFAGVSSYFSAGTRNNRRDAYSNAIMTQQSYSADTSYSEDGDATPTVSGEEQTNSFSAEQLFLYQANDITLKKNERASLRLFSLTVPASEVFEWTLNDAPNTMQRYLEYSSGSTSTPLLQDLSSKVWYALRLKNQTGMPWTTAPALSFREWKPIGQDMLSFTPIGGENILRVTPATEIIGTHTLVEKSRVQTELRYGGSSSVSFDLVTVEGTIKLRNIKKEAVELVLTRNLVGDVVSATDAGKISREGLNLQAVNPNSIVKWNVSLPSGEKEIKYTYKIYVRR
jgi:hypothetical protein